MSVSNKVFQGFIKGDQDAIAKVYIEYKNLMYFIIANYISNKDDADDVLSDAFLKAIENKERVKDSSHLKAYLCSIAKNESINFIKQEQLITSSDVIDEMYSEDDRTNTLLNDIEPLLSNKETIVIYYRAVFEYSWDDIYDLTGIPESTGRRLYTQAKETLRKVLL